MYASSIFLNHSTRLTAPLLLFLQITKKRMKTKIKKVCSLNDKRHFWAKRNGKQSQVILMSLVLTRDESLDDISAANICPIWVVVLNDIIMHI